MALNKGVICRPAAASSAPSQLTKTHLFVMRHTPQPAGGATMLSTTGLVCGYALTALCGFYR
ncbi:hypothetical protein OHS81_08725 [Streptomyces sp. NBC_00400]|uniref:hypothetical protein n=1 Tax=Streptomyces sp. NBC_00400 TaxID=2975737 RepID=UPI002E1B463D